MEKRWLLPLMAPFGFCKPGSWPISPSLGKLCLLFWRRSVLCWIFSLFPTFPHYVSFDHYFPIFYEIDWDGGFIDSFPSNEELCHQLLLSSCLSSFGDLDYLSFAQMNVFWKAILIPRYIAVRFFPLLLWSFIPLISVPCNLALFKASHFLIFTLLYENLLLWSLLLPTGMRQL